MTLHGFTMLPEEEQIDCTLENGVLTAFLETDNYIVILYQLDGFYVEAYCNRKTTLIERLRSFYSPEQLEPYLAAVDLSGLVGPCSGIHLGAAAPVLRHQRSGLIKGRSWRAMFQLLFKLLPATALVAFFNS
jgi:hypothetical protein